MQHKPNGMACDTQFVKDPGMLLFLFSEMHKGENAENQLFFVQKYYFSNTN